MPQLPRSLVPGQHAILKDTAEFLKKAYLDCSDKFTKIADMENLVLKEYLEEIADFLLQANTDVDFISEVTGLSAVEIVKIKATASDHVKH